ncbi:MAG: YybH family protein [Gemmatimonadales bacterium]
MRKEKTVPHEQGGDAILAEERRALDRWARGDPAGFVGSFADDVTYFDDIGAHTRIDGITAMQAYADTLKGKIPAHRYEIRDPKVQVYGDVGILTLQYEPYAPDGTPLTRWKATSVYRRSAAQWRVVHAHWSMVKAPPQ